MTTASSFNASIFDEAVKELTKRCRLIGRLHPACPTLRIPMKGRGLSPSIKDDVQRSCKNSGHHALTVMSALLTLDEPLKILREQHSLASGGLDLDIWNEGKLVLYINKSHVSMQYKPAELGGTITLAKTSERLAKHAALPLHNSTRVFELAKQSNIRGISQGPDSRFVLHAPSPALAFARLAILQTFSLKNWVKPHCAEVLVGKTFLDESRALVEAL